MTYSLIQEAENSEKKQDRIEIIPKKKRQIR